MEFISITGASAVLPSTDALWTQEIPVVMKRRDPRIWQMAYVAAQRCIAQCLARPASIVVATALGALDETKNFLDGVFLDGFGSPRNFIASVHNSMAGKLALEFKIPGPNLTLCDGNNSFASAIAACGLLSENDFPALVIAVDENIELLDRLIPHLSPECGRELCNNKLEGAIAFVIDGKPEEHGLLIRSSGVLFIGDENPDVAFTSALPPEINALPRMEIPPSKSRGSFISAATLAHEFMVKKASGGAVIGSFSPSSKSIGLVELCR
jgi:hypothetical protein